MPDKPRQTQHQGSQLQVYADLAQLYPNNEAYLKQYAELLLADGQHTTGIEILRHLYNLLIKKGDTSQADALTRQFPMIGRIRQSSHTSDDIHKLLPAFTRNRLWLTLHRKRLREGQYLFHRGELEDSLYLVCSGELAEFSKGADDKPVLLNLITPGDVVSENKLLQPGPHKSDVVANKSSVVIKLPRKKMMAALLTQPNLKTALQRKADYRRLLRLISSSHVLQSIPLHLRQHLATASYIQHYAAGSTIHQAGEQLSHVELVIQGGASYQLRTQHLTKTLKLLKPGALIGETASIQGAGCPADMVTDIGVSIVHMPYEVFINVVEAYPPLRNSLTAYTEEQRTQLMRQLNALQTQELNQHTSDH